MAKQKELKQVKMTDEMRTKLHGYSFVSGSIIVSYKLDIEGVHKDFLPVFKLKTLTITEIDTLRNTTLSDDTEEYYNDVIRSHIAGWSNMIDLSTEEEVEYVGTADGCDKDLYDKLPNTLKLDILQNLMKVSIK